MNNGWILCEISVFNVGTSLLEVVNPGLGKLRGTEAGSVVFSTPQSEQEEETDEFSQDNIWNEGVRVTARSAEKAQIIDGMLIFSETIERMICF